MNISLFIASRLQLSHNRHNGDKGSSPAIAIAVTGVALAVLVMMLSVAVVLGFKSQISEKVTGFDSAITVRAYAPTRLAGQEFTVSTLDISDSLMNVISGILPAEATMTLSITQPGILKTPDNFMGIIFNGADADGDRSFIADNLIHGEIPDYHDPEQRNSIVISQAIANQLNLDVADKVHAYFIIDNHVRVRNLTIAGIYDSYFGEYDRTYAFCDISLPQRLLDISPNEATALLINHIPQQDIQDVSIDLQNHMADAYYESHTHKWHEVDNVFHTGALYFNWLELLNTNVVVILILMALVSGFSLISCLFIIILERVSTIGLLKALGAPDKLIRRIFIYMAHRLVLRGMIIGNCLALIIMAVEHYTHIIPLDPDSYYLSYVPVLFSWPLIILLNAGIFLVSWAMLIIPSHLIAKISPAKTMHYE